MVKGVANVWVPVEDIKRALDFYRDILGFSVIKQDGPWAEIDANGFNIGLNGREPQGTRVQGGPIITFQPEEGLEAAVEELKGKEVEFPAQISEHEWGRDATFKDSEGNDLQLYEPPSGGASPSQNVAGTQACKDALVRRCEEHYLTKETVRSAP